MRIEENNIMTKRFSERASLDSILIDFSRTGGVEIIMELGSCGFKGSAEACILTLTIHERFQQASRYWSNKLWR